MRNAGRKTILFVNGGETIEGDTRVLVNSVRVLDPQRFRRICVTIAGPTCDELRRIPGVEVHVAPLGPQRVALPGPPGSALAFVAAVWSVAKIARAAGADIVYTYDRTRAAEAAFVAARLLRKKLVFHAHYPLYLDQRRVRRFVAFHSDRVIAISRYVAGHYLRAGCPPKKLTVVLNGAESLPETPFELGALRRRLGIAPDAPVLGIVGRLSPFKGHEELLRAVAFARKTVPDIRLIIAGRDTDESMWTHGRPSFRTILEELRTDLGLDEVVRFVGFNASATEIYAAADVAVFPSHEEPFGLVVIEGMLAGKPVISTNAGGVPEIVTDGETGLLVPPKDPEALSDAILRLLSDPALAARLAAAGQAHARDRFSLDRYAQDLQDVLEGVS